jgi:beta-glucosidase
MKHFVANDMETRRFNMDETIDERTLREVYLKPSEMALEAQSATAMTAYPKINGQHPDKPLSSTIFSARNGATEVSS